MSRLQASLVDREKYPSAINGSNWHHSATMGGLLDVEP